MKHPHGAGWGVLLPDELCYSTMLSVYTPSAWRWQRFFCCF